MKELLRRLRPRHVAYAQGIYYLITGIWPILHLASFLWVTGPKDELWLVQSFGAIIAVIGATLLLAARRGRVDPSARFLGLASALVFIAIDVVYHLAGLIPTVYLLDGLAQVGLFGAWLVAGRNRSA